MLTLFCAESSEKNILGWCTIFHELKSAVKAKIAQNNLQVSEGGITVKPGKDSAHELITGIWKVNPFVPSVACTWCQIASKDWWIFDCNFLAYNEMENISMDEIAIYNILQIQENWAG